MHTSFLQLIIFCLLAVLGPSSAKAAELLVNGGFETTGAGFTWVLQTNGTNQIDSWWNINNQALAHGGNRHEYLGAKSDNATAANNVDGTLYQTISIPSGADSAMLTYWLKITTSELANADYDHFYLEIRNTNNVVL